MAKAKPPTFKQAAVPQTGVIKGGPLDGFAYTLRGVEVEGGEVALLVSVSPPNWPFPMPDLVRLTGDKFNELGLVPGKWKQAGMTCWLQDPDACPCAVKVGDMARLVKQEMETCLS